MSANIDYGIQGAFKVDFYKSGSHEMEKTSDWFSNFITPTGLMYPLTYAFADCFRYLSIGSVGSANSGTTGLGGYGTTGLTAPLSSYKTNQGGSQGGQYIDWRGYSSGVQRADCGSTVLPQGLRLYRAWHIPTGGDNYFVEEDAGSLTIQEFMVSPSSGQDTIGKSAFSRITRNITIPNGYRVVVSYQLKINIQNTGATLFSAGTFSTGNAEVSEDSEIVGRWANLSGYYRQVYHGLRCIDNYGITYIPKFGDIMEPASRNLGASKWYLSPDNSQFDINITGGAQTSISDGYTADGLMQSVRQLNLDLVSDSTLSSFEQFQTAFNNNNPTVNTSKPSDTIPISIRIGRTNSALKLPQLDAYKTSDDDVNFNYQVKQDVSSKEISYATPGVKGFSNNYADFGKKTVFSSTSIQLPFSNTGQNLITGRKKSVTRRALFSPVNSLGYNTRFGSLVYAYTVDPTTDGSTSYYPIIDTLFFDSSGRSLMPHYRFVTGISLSERGTGVLDIHFRLSGKNGSVYKFTDKTGFFGPSQETISHALTTTIVSTQGGIDRYAGIVGSGNLNQGISGATGSTTVNLIEGGSFTSPYGWGALYGAVVNSGFYDLPPDLGLADHSLSGALRDPTTTGQLYWPMAFKGNELSFTYTGLKYFAPEIGSGFSDTGWFGEKQIIKNIEFEMVDPNNNYVVNTTNGFIKNVTGAIGSPYSGYYLTNKQFSGDVISSTFLIKDASATLTGYIIPRNITPGKLFGTVWKDAGNIPLASMSFLTKHVAGAEGGRRVYQFFTGLTDRGYPNGSGVPFSKNEELNVFFTGVSGVSGIYLTYISGTSPNAVGQSYLSGTINLTNFTPPIIRPLHFENYGSTGWRLAPNFAEANYYGSDVYSASAGGELPALSFDNGLELFLSISYSSPCGPTVQANTCNEPV